MVLTISAEHGLIDQEKYFNKSVAGKNLKNYYLLEKGDFAYNKSYSNGYPYGVVKKLNQYDKGIVSNLYICFKPNENINSTYLEQYFNSSKWNKEVYKIATEGARNHGLLNVGINDFFNTKHKIPIIQEQEKIGNFLKEIDTKIALMEQKQEKLEKFKKYVINSLFNSTIIKDGWKSLPLKEFLHEHKLKSTGKEEVYSVSVNKGVVNQIEHMGRSFSAKNTDKYNLVQPDDIIYTKSPTGDFPYGIIKQSHENRNVIVSPLYGVFTPETKELGYILENYFESPVYCHNYLHSLVQIGAKHTMNITNKTFLSKELYIPTDYNEQKKIYNTLYSLNNKIKLVKKEIKLVNRYKRGLIEKMFI